MISPIPQRDIPEINELNEYNSAKRISKIGFYFTLIPFIVFILLVVLARIGNNDNTHEQAASSGYFGLAMLFLITGIPLAVIGLIFSIRGYLKSARCGAAKWPGLCGISFFVLSFLSIIIAVMVPNSNKHHHERSFAYGVVEDTYNYENPTIKIEEIANPEETEDVVKVQVEEQANCSTNGDIIISVDDRYAKCYDNRIKKDKNPAKIDLLIEYEIPRQLRMWFKVNKISKNEPIIITNTSSTKYTYIVSLLEAMESLGVNNYIVK